MLDANQDAVEHIKELLRIHRNRLRVLELQQIRYGISAVPAHIILEIQEIRQNIVRLEADRRKLAPDQGIDKSPYVGLEMFKESEAHLFFGRDDLVKSLVDKVESQSFIAVLGPSGYGKSSVVRAGLLPQLKGGALPGSKNWTYLTMIPGSRPVEMLAGELTKLSSGDLEDAQKLQAQLIANEESLLQIKNLLTNPANKERLVIIIDQFEEIWTLSSTVSVNAELENTEQAAFIRLLHTAIEKSSTSITIIVTMRSDLLKLMSHQSKLAKLVSENAIIISPITGEELREIIVRPIESEGGYFEETIVETLIKQAKRQDNVLPITEHFLFEMWKHSTDNTITWKIYNDMGGIEGAVSKHAQSVYDNLSPQQQDICRYVFLRLVNVSDENEYTARRVPRYELYTSNYRSEDVDFVIDKFVQYRLLSLGDGKNQLSFSHEVLIGSWLKLKEWVEVFRHDLQIHRVLSDSVKQWDFDGRPKYDLYSGQRLENASNWASLHDNLLNNIEREFLRQSRTRANNELIEKAGIFFGVGGVVLLLGRELLSARKEGAKVGAEEERRKITYKTSEASARASDAVANVVGSVATVVASVATSSLGKVAMDFASDATAKFIGSVFKK